MVYKAWALVLFAAVTALLAVSADGAPEAGKTSPSAKSSAPRQDPCRAFPQKRLLIGKTLSTHSFLLNEAGALQAMPSFDDAPDRIILHKTYALSSDSIENISIYKTEHADVCVLGHNPDEIRALKVPVFFISRRNASEDDLQERVARLEFTDSEDLSPDENFDDIAFRLKHGGSLFKEIRPFFRCGLPGLLVCEERCPVESFALSGKLVDGVINREAMPLASERREAIRRAEAEAEDARKKAEELARSQTPPPAKIETRPSPPKKVEPAAPSTMTAPPPPPPAPPSPAPASGQSAPPSQTGSAALPQPSPPAAPGPALKKLTFIFQTEDGTPISAADVEKAEGALTFKGVRLNAGPDGSSADVTADVAEKAAQLAEVSQLLHHYRVTAATPQDAQILLTVAPQFIRADDLTLNLLDAEGHEVQSCTIKLLPLRGRELGPGWAKLASRPQNKGTEALQFVFSGARFELERPETISDTDLLIDIAEEGDAVTLSSSQPGCAFKESPFVTAQELRGLVINRSLRSTGPLLMVIMATNSTLEPAITAPNVEGFWSSALDLVGAVSAEAWERKILARAQSPGYALDTKIISEAPKGKAIDEAQDQRARDVKLLSQGSEPLPGPREVFEDKPIDLYDLDLALKVIRRDANILEVQSLGQEALLVISGGDPNAGHCRRTYRGELNGAPKPKWLQNARRVVLIDLWDEATLASLLQDGKAEAVDGAPGGVARCRIGGADGDKIKHFGLSYAVARDGQARKNAFAFLTAQAKAFLQP